jgi:glyoxylase I family protein
VSEAITAPPTTGVHHFSPTVSDVEASAAWYIRVLGMNRVPVTFPHHLDEDGGYAVVLVQPEFGVMIGLHHHEAHPAGDFDECRTGLDHIAFGVAERADLLAWTAWLDEQGVSHSGVQEVQSPMPFATVVFRDPDNIQLELIHMAS